MAKKAKNTESKETAVEEVKDLNQEKIAEWEQTIANEVDAEVEQSRLEELKAEALEQIDRAHQEAEKKDSSSNEAQLVVDETVMEIKPEYFPEYTITREGGLVFFDLKK